MLNAIVGTADIWNGDWSRSNRRQRCLFTTSIKFNSISYNIGGNSLCLSCWQFLLMLIHLLLVHFVSPYFTVSLNYELQYASIWHLFMYILLLFNALFSCLIYLNLNAFSRFIIIINVSMVSMMYTSFFSLFLCACCVLCIWISTEIIKTTRP